MEVKTYSATILSWVEFIVEESRRISTKAAGEMIIKWRLEILRQLRAEFRLKMKAVFVLVEKNNTDTQTQVNKKCSVKKENGVPTCCLEI